jgi:hypothetical protein
VASSKVSVIVLVVVIVRKLFSGDDLSWLSSGDDLSWNFESLSHDISGSGKVGPLDSCGCGAVWRRRWPGFRSRRRQRKGKRIVSRYRGINPQIVDRLLRFTPYIHTYKHTFERCRSCDHMSERLCFYVGDGIKERR